MSKNKIRLIRSLDQKKNRLMTGLFVAEGKKLLFDLLQSEIEISEVFCTEIIAKELIDKESDITIEIVDIKMNFPE